jgi:hypothetical protein
MVQYHGSTVGKLPRKWAKLVFNYKIKGNDKLLSVKKLGELNKDCKIY